MRDVEVHRRIWIDVKNSPDVLFFEPVIRRLEAAGAECIITSRDYAQTLGLLDLYRIPHTIIGRHAGAALSRKAVGLIRRSAALAWFGRGRDIHQTVSIGSNDISVASRILGLHNTIIQDYEGARLEHRVNFRLADKVMFPAAVPYESLRRLGLRRSRYRSFDGLKEQVTLADFRPDLAVPVQLGLDRSRPVAVLRPPATMSLYHRGIGSDRFDAALDYLLASDVQVVLLPRDAAQAKRYQAWGITIPPQVVDGPSLLYASDIVVSGGGTMNREAALMGVPAWTVFAGEMGAVDRSLVADGRLRILDRPDQLEVRKRPPGIASFEPLADEVTSEILRK